MNVYTVTLLHSRKTLYFVIYLLGNEMLPGSTVVFLQFLQREWAI